MEKTVDISLHLSRIGNKITDCHAAFGPESGPAKGDMKSRQGKGRDELWR